MNCLEQKRTSLTLTAKYFGGTVFVLRVASVCL